MSGPAQPGAVDSPMMRQYWSIKDRHRDALLFFRMGDFYELFFEDAKSASRILDISLTTRGRYQGRDIPMCGVPVHSADGYLMELIRAGQRVAVCEQTEDPEEARRRGSREVVRREVVRVITPGTLIEDALLEARSNNFLAAFTEVHGEGAVAWLDLSTGEFRVAECPRGGLEVFLARVAPRELLLPQRLHDDRELVDWIGERAVAAVPLGAPSFDSDSARERLQALFQVASLEPYGAFGRAELSAMGAVADYLHLTQRGCGALVGRPVRERPGERMQIDAATRRNLEIIETPAGDRAGSLLAAIDRTMTGAGARLLAARLSGPSTDRVVIGERLDAVAHFTERGDVADRVAGALRGLPDVERAMARLGLGRGDPRDLAALRGALGVAEAVAALLDPADMPPRLAAWRADIAGHAELRATLDAALVESIPADGDFVAEGYRSALDETRALRDESVSLIAALQESYRRRTGVASLRIRSNNVLGYFIEVREKHVSKLTAEEQEGLFSHRQTISSAGRFSTPELADLEGRIAGATARARDMEAEIFAELRELALDRHGEIAALAAALARIDLATALARLARDAGWRRPEVTEDLSFRIVGGRHPVVEKALREGFVANDCDLSADGAEATPLWVVTGPNMAGKSTFLRQNALAAVLAQAGSFVPAHKARIGLVDRLFSRVGAADDLARGRSTFMVEMVETAAILHQATPRSLVILDEIGRGTATYDGLSIAWAVLEHLREVNRSRALFATHFHELTELASRVGGVRNVTVRATEWEGRLVFLHQVDEGVADRSYGVQVARLAGLPESLIARASQILERLESGGERSGALDELPLFDPNAAPSPPPPSEVESRLAEVDPDALTPREALEILYGLRALLR